MVHESERAEDRGELEREWLGEIRMLTAAIHEAMQAAAAHQPTLLLRCLERQQRLCSSLGRLALQRKPAVVRSLQPDAVLAGDLRKAAAELCAMNAQYAAFLRHSGRTLRMFSALEHRGEHYLPRPAGPVWASKAGQPSWSCEG